MTADDTTRKVVCLGCGAVNRVPEGRALTAAKCGRCAEGLATPVPIEITASDLAALEAKDTGSFLVDLWAPWCGPCRMMAPHYEAVAGRVQADVRLFKLNTDDFPDVASRLGLRGVPTLMGWKGGRRVVNQPGAQSGPALERWTRQAFGLAPSPNA